MGCAICSEFDCSPTAGLSGDIHLAYLGHWVACNFSDAVIVHCDIARKALAKKYGRRHDVYIIAHPNYIGYYPNNISKEDARKTLGLEPSYLVFLFFGGIRPNKGIEHLVSAFKDIPGDRYRLIIAGKPNQPTDYFDKLVTASRASPQGAGAGAGLDLAKRGADR